MAGIFVITFVVAFLDNKESVPPATPVTLVSLVIELLAVPVNVGEALFAFKFNAV